MWVNNTNIFIERRYHKDGSISNLVNNKSVSQKKIKERTNTLIDMHGQHDHQNLLDKRQNVEKIISDLFKYFYNSPKKLPEDWRSINEPIERVICDYISGMTDRYASRLHKDLYE